MKRSKDNKNEQEERILKEEIKTKKAKLLEFHLLITYGLTNQNDCV